MRERWLWFRETYLTMDPRSLGLFRILFGLVLLSDLARRFVDIELWYTNSGLLPNHTILWRPPAQRMFSLFFTASGLREAQVGFVLCAAVYLAFTLGYRTRLFQVLTLIARVSLNSRLAVLENGGDMVMDLLCLLTLPLPLGARFSLDAVALSPDRKQPLSDYATKPIVSIAVLGLLLQFATIYFFNAASKGGVAWRDGTAVHYALHQDKLVTPIGVWMRETLPLDVIKGLTWGTLATEWIGCILIITPFSSRQARGLAVCLMPPLHLGFALGLNLGGFSPAMMSFFPLLLTAQHWEKLEGWLGERVRPLAERAHAASLWLLRGSQLPAPAPAPVSARWRSVGEVAMGFVLLAILSEVLNDNSPVPKALRVRQPDWAKAVIEYPRILQGWRMFASEPPRTDSMIHVEAVTASGKKVDPYNEAASNQAYPSGKVVPSQMGQSQYFVMYSDRIPNQNYAAYRQAFQEWLLAYPERTGDQKDCLLNYSVYYVSDQSPPPGETVPKPLERTVFMSYAAPYDSPCRQLAAAKQQPQQGRARR